MYKRQRQVNVATGIAYGNVYGNNWNSEKKDFDVFDIKSDLMRILKSLNTPVDNLNYEEISNKIFHPGKSSSLRIGKNIIANFGELNPILLKSLNNQMQLRRLKYLLKNWHNFKVKKHRLYLLLITIHFKQWREILLFYFPNQSRQLI